MSSRSSSKLRSERIKLVLAVAVVLALAINTSAIGVSPGTIRFSNMVRGGYGEKSLTISNAASDDLTIKIEASGEIKDWITFEPSEEELVIQKKSAKTVIARINVPNTARNGDYNGEVVISSLYQGSDPLSGGSGARFMAGLIVKIQLTVTGDEISSYKIKSISVKDTEEGYPIEFTISVENTGNVIVTPNLVIEILDSNRLGTGKAIRYNETSILPTITKQFTIKMPTRGMNTGAYYARITSDRGDDQTLFFQILSLGTLALRGNLEQISLNKIWVRTHETVKVEATFSNEGDLVIESARVKGEVYKTDTEYGFKELVGVFEGDSMSVDVGDYVTLLAYFTPEEAGVYSIEGFVVYSGKRTDVKSTVLNVLERETSYTVYYFLIGGLIFIVTVFYLTRSTTRGWMRVEREATYRPPAEKPAEPRDIYSKLKSKLKGIKEESILFVSAESEQEPEAVASLLKILINEMNMDCIYVTVSRPYEDIISEMKKFRIKTDKLYAIDSISYMAGKKPEPSERSIFVENPSSLEEVNMYIDKFLMKIKGPKFVFIDNLSSLLIYNEERSVEEFTHLIINKIRLEKVGGVVMSVKQKEVEALRKTLVPMCDKEVML